MNRVVLDLPLQPVQLLDVEVGPEGHFLDCGDGESCEEPVQLNGHVLGQFSVFAGFKL